MARKTQERKDCVFTQGSNDAMTCNEHAASLHRLLKCRRDSRVGVLAAVS